MFPRSPEHAVVFPIIPEAVSVVMLAGTVAFWCHFALKSDLLINCTLENGQLYFRGSLTFGQVF